MANFLFYVMAIASVGAALVVVLARSAMTGVLALLASFFALSTIYLLAGFQLLAAAQILVYAGAILVLFLFVIMLLNLGNVTAGPGNEWAIDLSRFKKRHLAWTLAIAGLLLAIGTATVLQSRAALVEPIGAKLPPGGIDALQPMAAAMFSRYLLPFEATSLLLLATAVAIVVLAKRDRGARVRGAALGVPSSTATPTRAPIEAAPNPTGIAAPILGAGNARRRDEETSGARP